MWTAEEVYPKPHKSIACNKICVMKLLGARRLLAGLTLLLLLPSPAPSPAPTLSGPELIGFSFSPSALAAGGPSAESTLAKLMARLHPDLVRLPVYWDAVAPASNAFDFSPVDGLLTTISEYNLHHRRSAHVLLGLRDVRAPARGRGARRVAKRRRAGDAGRPGRGGRGARLDGGRPLPGGRRRRGGGCL